MGTNVAPRNTPHSATAPLTAEVRSSSSSKILMFAAPMGSGWGLVTVPFGMQIVNAAHGGWPLG